MKGKQLALTTTTMSFCSSRCFNMHVISDSKAQNITHSLTFSYGRIGFLGGGGEGDLKKFKYLGYIRKHSLRSKRGK